MANQNINQFLRDNPEEWYYPEALKSGSLTVQEMRKQYTYFRDVAMKRLSRLGESEFADSQAYLKNIKQFKPLSQIETESELITRLYTVQKFLRLKGSTIRGQKEVREKAVKAAQEKGLDFINESNIAEFGQYMDYLRAKYKGAQFDSERALRLFVAAEKKDITTHSNIITAGAFPKAVGTAVSGYLSKQLLALYQQQLKSFERHKRN